MHIYNPNNTGQDILFDWSVVQDLSHFLSMS